MGKTDRIGFFGRLAAAIVCAGILLGLSACGKKDDPKPVELQEGPRFTIAVAQTPDNLNPLLSKGGLAEEFFLICYDPLWRTDGAGNPVGCIAEDWSLSSDRLTWTIRLRHDAVFSDGVPVTSADVLFSYDLMRHNDTIYSGFFRGISEIRCPDDYTVVISTEYVKGDMLYNPTPILPRHIWREYEFDPGSFDNAGLVGSGPFVYDPDASGEEGWLFRARSDHFDDTPHVGEVFFASYGTVTGAARALSAGEADASFGLTDVQLTTLESVPGVELVQAVLPEADCCMLVFNARQDRFFQKDAFRQMIEYSVDKEWFLSMSSGGAGMTGASFLSPGIDGFAVPDGLRTYNPAATSAALASIGYRDVDDDGLLEYGIRDSELNLTLYTSNQDEWAATAATILSADLTDVGVKVDWRKTDKPITEACGPKDNWDMCMFTWKGKPNAAVTAALFGDVITELSGWKSDEFVSSLSLLRSAEDRDAVQGYARQLQQLVYDACPVVVLTYDADIQGIRSDAWTGYEDLIATGGLFSMGSSAIYTCVMPRPTVG